MELFARRHLNVGGRAPAPLAIRPEPALQVFGERPIDDAGRQLARHPREVLERRTFKTAVDDDWALSRRYGITGVPTFVAGRYGVVGAQPYEALEKLVEKAESEPAAE